MESITKYVVCVLNFWGKLIKQFPFDSESKAKEFAGSLRIYEAITTIEPVMIDIESPHKFILKILTGKLTQF
jgi:hypothetical protein